MLVLLFYSRQSGHKFGEYIEKFVPLILRCSKEEDDELREFCLQAFESFVMRCPKEITPNIRDVSISNVIFSHEICGNIYIYITVQIC